jgi:hypothetical protein
LLNASVRDENYSVVLGQAQLKKALKAPGLI